MRTPELLEKAEICKYLDSIGAWYFKPMMNGFGKAGVPDIIVCLNGRFIGIEVKREGKEPTTIQIRRMEEIRKAEGIAVWGTAARAVEHLKLELEKRRDEEEQSRWEAGMYRSRE